MSIRQGNNTIAGATNYIPDLLDWKWADHILDNISWLRSDTFSWQPGLVYVRVYQHLAADIVGKTLQSETVRGTTIQFYLADDGHKICPASQESAVETIFKKTGESWYYIIDTTNQRFKLPRKKDTSIKEVYNGTDGITILSNGLVIQKKPNRSGSEWFPNLNLVDTSRPVGASAASYGAAYAGERTMYFGTEWTGTEFISHARENYSGPSGTLYGATLISYATDEQISAFIGGKFVADGSEKYLYFYVGRFTQTALENTAGLNTELFNGKADVSTVAHVVTEFQQPTSANNYTWYRKYADGWVEQGGIADYGSYNYNARSVQVSLPVAMSNAQYQVLSGYKDADSPNDYALYCGYNPNQLTTTGFRITTWTPDSGCQYRYVWWQVSGMAA